jgi:hypothetical protein
VWQAAHVMSRTSSFSWLSKCRVKPTGSWSGLAAVGAGSTMKPKARMWSRSAKRARPQGRSRCENHE